LLLDRYDQQPVKERVLYEKPKLHCYFAPMNTETPIRILVVDDSVVYRKIVKDVLTGMDGVEVVGVAANGKIAMQRIEQCQPDLLTLDLEMPEMDGLEVLRQLKNIGDDVRAIMLSGANTQDAKSTMTALELGAFDFVAKPTSGSAEENVEMLRHNLCNKIQAFASARHIHALMHNAVRGSSATVETSPGRQRPHYVPKSIPKGSLVRPEVVAIGISTGGPAALIRMLPRLPVNLSVPVLIVQHMPPVFTNSLATDLNRRCALAVCEASDGQQVVPGHVYIAPGGKQMKIEQENEQIVVHITDDPPENSCRPSVDYLFRSVAKVYGGNAIGVIMTGMGSDGTLGCRQMKQQGASIIAQDKDSCVVFGMPRAPVEEGVADVVAPLDSIAAEIVRIIGKGI
jgi:two-component system, chemotaxis family, protein-glutamate methylesterase/glutaminase